MANVHIVGPDGAEVDLKTLLEAIDGGTTAIADGTDATKKAVVTNTAPGGSDNGLVVRPVGGGDASAANQTTGNASLASIDTKTPALGQAVAGSSTPVVLPATQITTLTPPAAITGFATAANQTTELTDLGGVTETAPASDTASSGLNGRLQRIAQRLTSLIALLPTALGGAGGLKVEAVAALPAGTNNIGDVDVLTLPAVTGTVTANAGTNLNTSALALETGGNLATVAGAIRAEDAASADAHTGIGLLAVRKATPANTSGTDGDYEFLQMSAGRLWVSAAIDTPGLVATAANQAVPASAVHGELAGSVTAVQMPSVAGTHALLKARANNTGNIYSGNSSGVTRPDGSTDTTTGMEIPPGEQKVYSLTANLNELYRICDNVGDALVYEVW